jgi:hypothetical protein
VLTSFVYDGDGNRVKKTEGGETTVYVNKYYEKNITTAEETTSYYPLSGKDQGAGFGQQADCLAQGHGPELCHARPPGFNIRYRGFQRDFNQHH